MARLHPDILARLPDKVEKPAYDRDRVRVGIVHLGIGAFHRAHQQVFTDDVLARGATEWGICGVDLLGPEVRDKLAPQEWLYTAATQSGEGQRLRVIGALREILVGPDDPEALIARMGDPAIRIASVTVTEKGYCHDPATGELNMAHPGIKADLASPARPTTVIGTLAAALDRRRKAGTVPFTVMSCDNLFQNGRIARAVVTAFAEAVDPALGRWVAENVAFPCTMVDRITPATTPEDIARVNADLGAEDAWPVVCEPFKQWVIEDNFPEGRPDWGVAGAEIVADVEPFEFMKLRLLNGSHSALSYLGGLAGHVHISDVMAQPAFVAFMRRLMDEEITPTLDLPPGVDVAAYKDSLIERFTNPAIKHRTAQIAMDGSQKLPQRILGPVRERLAGGGTIGHLALVVAAWIRYATGLDEAGATFEVSDPMAARFREIAAETGRDPAALTKAFLSLEEVFGGDLPQTTVFVEAVTAWLDALYAKGAAATVNSHYGH